MMIDRDLSSPHSRSRGSSSASPTSPAPSGGRLLVQPAGFRVDDDRTVPTHYRVTGPADSFDELGFSLDASQKRDLLDSAHQGSRAADEEDSLGDLSSGGGRALSGESAEDFLRRRAQEQEASAQGGDPSKDALLTVRSSPQVAYGSAAEQRRRRDRLHWFETWDYDKLDDQYAEAWKIAKKTVGAYEEGADLE